jgi:hypothetical protein
MKVGRDTGGQMGDGRWEMGDGRWQMADHSNYDAI